VTLMARVRRHVLVLGGARKHSLCHSERRVTMYAGREKRKVLNAFRSIITLDER